MLHQVSLERGRRFDVDFSTGIARSLVGVPIVSCQALERMASLGAQDAIDNVLLEWWLMITLHEHGKLARILPVVVGDAWSNAGIEPTIRSFEQLGVWIACRLPPHTVSHATLAQLRSILGLIGLGHLTVRECSVRTVVQDLLRFDSAPMFALAATGTGHVANTQTLLDSSGPFQSAVSLIVQAVTRSLPVAANPNPAQEMSQNVGRFVSLARDSQQAEVHSREEQHAAVLEDQVIARRGAVAAENHAAATAARVQSIFFW